MSLQPIRGVKEYKRLKDSLRSRFESEKTGDQSQMEDQTKLFQPLISSQQITAENLKDKLDSNQLATEFTLAPLTRAIQQRNAIEEMRMLYPKGESSRVSSPAGRSFQEYIEFDKPLTMEDEVNLSAMGFELPSTIYGKNLIEVTKTQITHYNRSIGCLLGKKGNPTPSEKEDLESKKNTLIKLKSIVSGLEGGLQFVTAKKRARTGTFDGYGLKNGNKKRENQDNVIYYGNVGELCSRLALLYAAKESGNNGVNNDINSILDELLRIGAVDKEEYDKLYNKIF